MKAYFLEMLTYNKWANDLVLNTLLAEQVTDEKSINWINHVINAEILWLDRAIGQGISVMPWDDRPLEACQQAAQVIHQRYLAFINQKTDEELVSSIFSYHNTSGQPYSNTYGRMLAHVINHSTHHRGQIIARLRELGITPPITDYIFYLRR